MMSHLNVSNSTSTSSSLESQVSSGILGICFLLGVPGNISVVLLILRLAKRDNFTLHLMLNLAAADLLCLLPAPLLMYNLLAGWHIGVFLCKGLFFTVYLSVNISVFTTMLISIHRFIFVIYPNCWARLGHKGERGLLVALWGIAFVFCICLGNVYDVKWDGNKHICWRIVLLEQDRLTVLLVETAFVFVLPISVITISYCCLHRKVHQTALFSRNPGQTKLTRLVTSIVMTFLILWIPLQCANLLEIFAISIKSSNSQLHAKLTAIKKMYKPFVWSLIFINSSVNPLLYFINYRKNRPSTPVTIGMMKVPKVKDQIQ